MKYISFDNYYKQSEYNRFILSAYNNNVKYEEFISIRTPFAWWIKVDDENLPKFLDYDETKDTKWLVSKIKARYPNEEVILKRRDNDPKQDIRKFIENDVLEKARTEKFVCVFYFQGNKIRDYSVGFKDKIYILGLKGAYRIGVCFNPYIQDIVEPSTIILIEKDGDYRNVGEIEQRINYVWKPNIKLTHKTLESSYYYNGDIKLIHRPIIKLS